MEKAKSPQERLRLSVRELADTVRSFQILDEDDVENFVNVILRYGKFEPERLIDSYPTFYNFVSADALLRSAALVYKLSLAWFDPSEKSFFVGLRRQKKIPVKQLNDLSLFSLASDLNFRNNLEVFQKFSTRTQSYLSEVAFKCSPNELFVLMTMMNKTSLDLSYALVMAEKTGLSSNLKSLIKTAGLSEVYDIQPHSDEMTTLMFAFDNDTCEGVIELFMEGWYLRRYLLPLFALLYGEATVVDVLCHLKSASSPVTPDALMEILDNWENLKEYPAEWIMQTRV